MKTRETISDDTEVPAENGWNGLEQVGEFGAGDENAVGRSDENTGENDHVEMLQQRQEGIARAAAKVRAAYDAAERKRVDAIKADLDSDFFSVSNYESREIKDEPTTFRKAMRLLTDKLGIKTKQSEERREREAIHVALVERQREDAEKLRVMHEEAKRRAAERARHEEEWKKEEKRREQEFLEHQMSELHDAADFNKRNRFQRQRIQEIVERDLNERLLKIDDLEVEALAKNPEIQKRCVDFEDTKIPVYDLKGLPFSVLSTTIDYRSVNDPGEIGTETFRKVMDNPAVWDARRDEAERESGFGTRRADARGDTISTSYYNSECNLDSHVSGDLMYGFEKVDGDSIIAISNGDGGTSNRCRCSWAA